MWKEKAIFIALAICVVTLPFAVRAEDWRETGCAGVVEKELEKIDIAALGPARVTYIVSSRGGLASEGSEELNGWVSFKNCKGNLTVQLSENCTVTAMYTSGECQIPDVPQY